MGEFTITTSMSVFVWLISVGVIGVNLYIVGGFLVEEGMSTSGGGGVVYAAGGMGAFCYLGFVVYLIRQDLGRLGGRAGALFSKLGVGDVADISELQREVYSPESRGLLQRRRGVNGVAGRHWRWPLEEGGSDGVPETELEEGGEDEDGDNKGRISGPGADYAPTDR